jgi:chemotaxis protein MotA
MSPAQALDRRELPEPNKASLAAEISSPKLDGWMLAGVVIVLAAMAGGIAFTGVNAAYFFQPAGVLIVIGGTLGVMFITTPGRALLHSLRRVKELLWHTQDSREALIEEVVSYSRIARKGGLLAIEPLIAQTSDSFLSEALLLALDVEDRADLQATLEIKIRLRERHGEADAKALEVAGGFAPTIGVLGTVVGLIDVLRQFSNPASVVSGIGTAFVSTIYGLALANLVLLPAAHRIRAKVAEAFETEELIADGVLCLFDGIHPSLVLERLNNFLRKAA